VGPSDWRISVCDLSGNKLAGLQRIASKRRLSYRLNRSAQLEFELPADDPRTLQVQAGRTVKAWRKEGSTYVLRYAGFIWQVSDEGDENTYKTKVVCFDPFQAAALRLVRDASNNVPADGKVTFTAVEAELIIRQLLGRTNAGGGICGLGTSGTGPTGFARTVTYEFRDVASAILELCEGTGINFYVQPQDTTDGYLGVLIQQGAISNVAANKLVWGGPTHNVRRVERTEDMAQLANDIRVLGTPAVGSARPVANRTSAGSITTYGRRESVRTYGDITVQGYINSLADREIALRDSPRVLAKFTPQPDVSSANALNPWQDFNLGYLVEVFAGAALRGGLSGQQRIWGWDIDLDDNAVERISAIYTGADA
jgi:hypothetical protein